MPRKKMEVIDENGDEITLDLPATREKCQTCDGKGTHVNPSIDGNGLPQECVDDPEFMADYMGGVYDVQCEECKGERIVLVVDRDACPAEDLALLDDHYRTQRELDAEAEAERRAGA
jgi:hypothetical protein